ncbi:polyhydroxyalkanoate depolymerase [Methylobacterium sp. B4]|uniref:polyhydroxyalkanoate depolymerase n=1 Tax=Methylobacterium sp. B4 TaxID=1938755 RepID=UPI000D760B3B|nr:polyhydroxyalkanoate depolymerase [Methylobacterium sp. B4]PXW62887.1 polyhydroxyalkanoate depolymerase [Methylobacterium sp. B4]
MLYPLYEAGHLMLAPMRLMAEATRIACENPFNPLAYAPQSRAVAAGCEMFERTTRVYAKPAFGLGVPERIVWERPFCRVIAFGEPSAELDAKPKLLIVAPMSGHYATLLRGTVEGFLSSHQVFITDWADARQVAASAGRFGLDDYIDTCIALFEALGPDLHVAAVCQPSVPVLAAIARMEAEDRPLVPRSAVLMGGPVDTRRSPTAVNALAQEKGLAWFERHCIHTVPGGYPGAGRSVYPGFLQLAGFMGMNFDRHADAHHAMFDHLVRGDGDSAARHRAFYDEYLAVMDLTAEFYLETIERVFVNHDLPRGTLRHHGRPVDLGAIRRCHLMAVEGEKDDITGIGQTRAALELAVNLPDSAKRYHLQPGAGHYGIFNGSRFRQDIVPLVRDFMEHSLRPAALRQVPVVPAEEPHPILLREPAAIQPPRAAPTPPPILLPLAAIPDRPAPQTPIPQRLAL